MFDFSIALCDYRSVKEIEFTSAAVRQWRKLSAATRADRSQIKDVRGNRDRRCESTQGRRRNAVAFRCGSCSRFRVLFTMKANTITIHAVWHRREIYD